jgi:hypothetical protein
VKPLDATRGYANFANVVVALCPPLTLLSLSSLAIFVWTGRLAILVAAIAALASLLLSGNKPSIWTILIGAAIGCLIIVGWGMHGMPDSQAYLQVSQLLVFGIVVANYRKAVVGFKFQAISLALVSLMIVVLTWRSSASAGQHDGAFAPFAAFGPANIFAFCCAILTVFAFLSSKVTSAGRMRLAAYLLCVLLVLLIALSGSRGAMLMLVVFFSVYLLGILFKGNKTLFAAAAGLTLAMVPVVTIGYPIAVGARINFLPSPGSSNPSERILSLPACVPTAFETCKGEPISEAPTPTGWGGGFLGLYKSIRSGRQNIWPAVIEMSGKSPVWGHGLGALPGRYLAAPYTGRSAHNGFLQIYYQLGLVGVALYALVWCLLFIRAIGTSDILARSAAVAVLCAACVLETFEVVFVQNLLGIGIALAIMATTQLAGGTGRGATREPA